MWRSRDSARQRMTCPACGRQVTREDAREYDKYGDRWDREAKTFEYFCRPCHDALCHQGRTGLESLLTEAGAGDVDREEFLRRYALVTERPGPHEEP